MAQLHSYYFRVTGRVQGVFFRASTQSQARKLKLTGWVKNCADGSVEGTAQGGQEQLDIFHDWLKHGPKRARVETLQFYAVTQIGDPHNKFIIIR